MSYDSDSHISFGPVSLSLSAYPNPRLVLFLGFYIYRHFLENPNIYCHCSLRHPLSLRSPLHHLDFGVFIYLFWLLGSFFFSFFFSYFSVIRGLYRKGQAFSWPYFVFGFGLFLTRVLWSLEQENIYYNIYIHKWWWSK